MEGKREDELARSLEAGIRVVCRTTLYNRECQICVLKFPVCLVLSTRRSIHELTLILVFHPLPGSAWAVVKLAEMAEQRGNTVEYLHRSEAI